MADVQEVLGKNAFTMSTAEIASMYNLDEQEAYKIANKYRNKIKVKDKVFFVMCPGNSLDLALQAESKKKNGVEPQLDFSKHLKKNKSMNTKGYVLGGVFIIGIIIYIVISIANGTGHKSDFYNLSDEEQQRAKDAYELQEIINDIEKK